MKPQRNYPIFKADMVQLSSIATAVNKRTGAEVKLITYVGPVIGSHTGAGVIALCFVGKER